ncbi:reticulon-1 isoform X2 [Ambystoma mexicanum]
MSGQEPPSAAAQRSSAAGEEEKAEAATAGLSGSSEQAAAGAGTSSAGTWAQLPPLVPGGGDQELRRAGSGVQEPAVTMETPSTGNKPSDDYDFSEMSEPGERAVYTSLISEDRYSSQHESNYLTGILQKEQGSAPDAGMARNLSIGEHSPQDGAISGSRRLFSSDSGIEMTPAESTDGNKIPASPVEQETLEAYKYIDIRRSEDLKGKDSSGLALEGQSTSTPGRISGPLMKEENMSQPQKKSPENTPMTQYESLSEDMTFLPYMDEACDASERHRGSIPKESRAAPVTITLTETESSAEPGVHEPPLKKCDASLMPGPDVVPTVTVSEPEDDSPGSLTPSSTGTEPSGSENLSKYSISEDELINAIKAKDGASGFSFKSCEDQQAPSVCSETPDAKNLPGTPAAPSSPLDNEASSADSGDSEIELVSEEQATSEEAMHSTYMTFSHIGGPPPSPASPSIQYSILREEREAELDSELIIESCDGSSASEESPKRDQDSPLMKPFHMDIIEEENGSRNDGTDGSDYEVNNATESKMNRENLAESASYMKCAFAASEAKIEPPHSKMSSEQSKDKLTQKKPVEATVFKQSKTTSKDSGRKSAIPLSSSSSLTFLNKKKAIDLLYWRDLKQTGIVFGSVLLMLFSLTQFSVVSVIAYLALAALSATISFRIYKSVLQAVQKTDEGHPFKPYLEMEVSLSQDQIQKYTDCLQMYMNSTVKELRRLFLVQDLVDSLKFAVLMWLLTYVGALFNGLTLLIMAVVSMFSLPAVYDKYQPQIDQYLGLMRTHMNAVVAK